MDKEQVLTQQGQKKKRKWYEILLTIIITIMFVVTLCFVTFSIIFAKIEVVGVSMQPTYNVELEEGKTRTFYEASPVKDKVYVNRFSKGKRGDVIVVNHEENGIKTKVIKRLVAIGGDSVDIQFDTDYYYLYVNGEKQVETYIKDYERMQTCYENLLLYKKNNGISSSDPIILGEKEIFVLGDNRGVYSKDSSVYGPLQKSTIVGKVVFYVPYNTNFFSHIIFKTSK